MLSVTEYNVILGMDQLSAFHIVLECFNKKVTFTNYNGTVYTNRRDTNELVPYPTLLT